MIRRLRIKFICITMAIVTVMMSLLLFSQINFTKDSLMQINMKALEDAIREFEGELPPRGDAPGDRKDGAEKPKPDKSEFMKPEREHPCFVLAMNRDGILEAGGAGYYDLTDMTVLADIHQRVSDRTERSGVLWDYELQFLRSGDPAHPVYAFTDISGELETMRAMFRNSVLIWILGFFGFLILSVFLANWAIRPVEKAWEQQRQFVADASHELKTPLTVILTNAELLREKSENHEQRHISDSIITMSVQMKGLVEHMLQLARADSGTTAAQREKLDWSSLLEQTVLPFEPMYFEAGLTLESRIAPGVTVSGNAAQLRQVAEVLLDNALKYAAPGGTVRLTLESRGCQCCLRVSSPGQTLTQQQCRDIFKRFYRVDPARRRDGSYGLGLAIAERVVSGHRGKIWAEGRDGINTFYVNLPMG